MVDKLKNVSDDFAGEHNQDFLDKLNKNFKEIKTKSGLTYIQTDEFTITPDNWVPAMQGNLVRDVNDPDRQGAPEQCIGYISHRAFVYVDVSAATIENVTLTDLIPMVVILDQSPDNVTMRKEIAKCGIDLVDHTSLSALREMVVGRKRIYLMFQAVSSKPNVDLKYKLLLY